jgi:hypothetical protein
MKKRNLFVLYRCTHVPRLDAAVSLWGVWPFYLNRISYTSGKRGFHPPPLVPKLLGPGLKGALVPVRAAGARPAPSPDS